MELKGNYKILQQVFNEKGVLSEEFYFRIINFIKHVLAKKLKTYKYSEDNVNDCYVEIVERTRYYDSSKGSLGNFIYYVIWNYANKSKYHLKPKKFKYRSKPRKGKNLKTDEIFEDCEGNYKNDILDFININDRPPMQESLDDSESKLGDILYGYIFGKYKKVHLEFVKQVNLTLKEIGYKSEDEYVVEVVPLDFEVEDDSNRREQIKEVDLKEALRNTKRIRISDEDIDKIYKSSLKGGYENEAFYRMVLWKILSK